MKPGTTRLSDVARHLVAPSGITSTGWPVVRDTCERLGWGFDGWQDGLGRLILSKRADGLYACERVVISIPRQVGKTYLMGAIVFALCLIFPGLTVIWTAHRVKTARETFNSMAGMATQECVKPHVAAVVRGRGDEAINFANGSRILFGARESGFGRGFADVDILVFDEAQILTDAALDDMLASQNVAENPLTLFTGTPPRPRDPGEVFTMYRQEALDGEADDSLYVEFSADRGCDPGDREQWRKANPSFPHRTPERALLRLKKNLTPDSWMREGMGVWDEVSKHQAVVKPTVWAALADVGPGDSVRPDALGVDMSHGRDISISACWIEDDSAHVEEVWSGSDSSAAIDWIVANARRIPVVIDDASPAMSLVPALEARRVKVRRTRAADMARACGMFLDRVTASLLTHADQHTVNSALAGARKRPIRDAGGWGWDRRDSTVSIYPIVAATLALLGATESHRPGRSTERRTRKAVIG